MSGDVADHVAAQARELFAHLPAGELEDDAELMFRTDAAGRLQVAAGDTLYLLRDGAAWRCRPAAGGMVAVEAWRDRELVGTAHGPAVTLLGGTPDLN